MLRALHRASPSWALRGLSPPLGATATFLASALLPVFLPGCDRPPELTPAETSGLDDDFDGATLSSSWSAHDGEHFRRELHEGQLVLTPTANTVWYKADAGPGLFKMVKGNFRVTTRVTARSAKKPSEPVGNDYQFAGLIARDPGSDASGEESYVFNVVGYRKSYLSIETKTTKDDESDVLGPEWDSGDAELRICRVNGNFLVLKRRLGDTEWTLGTTYERNDLPAELQVGPIAYTYTNRWDLRASFDWVRFAPVSTERDCYHADA